jgi:hypothetical protein
MRGCFSAFGCDIELYLWPHFGIGTKSVWSPSRLGSNIGFLPLALYQHCDKLGLLVYFNLRGDANEWEGESSNIWMDDKFLVLFQH